jgi:recombination protein RecA
MGSELGLVQKSGSWFAYKDERIGQGRENAKRFVEEHPDIAAELRAQILTNYKITAGATAGAANDGEIALED